MSKPNNKVPLRCNTIAMCNTSAGGEPPPELTQQEEAHTTTADAQIAEDSQSEQNSDGEEFEDGEGVDELEDQRLSERREEEQLIDDQEEQQWEGQRVILHGLKGAAELNGRLGMVTGPIDTSSGRFEVVLEPRGAEGERICHVKPANLELAPVEQLQHTLNGETVSAGDRVSIFGVKSRTELNGELAFLVEHDNVKHRWTVRMPNKEVVSLSESVLTPAPVKSKKNKGGKKKQQKQQCSSAKAAMDRSQADEELEKEVQAMEHRQIQMAKKAKEKKPKKVDAVEQARKEAAERAEKQMERMQEDEIEESKNVGKKYKMHPGDHEMQKDKGTNGQQNRSRSSFVKSFLKP